MHPQDIWKSALVPIQASDPEFAEAFSDFAGLHRPAALSGRMRALILFGLNISVSHMNADAAREAARAARASGAMHAELCEVAQLTVLLGIHSVVLVADFLADKAAQVQPMEAKASPADIAIIKAAYLESRGFIPPPIERFLEVDPVFVDAYRRLSEIPFRRANLSPKEAELIVIALDASVNHLHQVGCQAHIAAALAAGASAAEVAEALQLAAAVAGHGASLGYAIAEEVFGDA